MKNNIFSIISGSTRENSQSQKVARYILTQLKNMTENTCHLIDLSIDHFPLWHEDFWSLGINWNDGWNSISNKLKQSDGFVFVVPEWNGMLPPQLNNFFHLSTNGELAHKPGLIVTISSGQGGSYPLAELRMNSVKNTKICYIPESIVIRDIKNLLNDNADPSDPDKYIRARLEYSLSCLNVYTNAFKTIRSHECLLNKNYPYGM